MGKPKWWVCGACRSLNDLPADKCYHCRASKPSDPMLMDDQYAQVGGGSQRVGVSVDRSRIGELTAPDPVERATGRAFIDTYQTRDDQPLEAYRDEPRQKPPPLRDPRQRSIAEAGGVHWSHGLTDPPPTSAPPAASSQAASRQSVPAGYPPPQPGIPPGASPAQPMPPHGSPKATPPTEGWPPEDPLR